MPINVGIKVLERLAVLEIQVKELMQWRKIELGMWAAITVSTLSIAIKALAAK